MNKPPEAAAPKTILVVEDNPINIGFISDYLEAFGYRLLAARNGFEAIQKVSREQVDLVLMDVQMPGMDGFEATRAIRSLPDVRQSSVPIIMVTALVMPGDMERCMAAGANHYMPKPINLKELASTVQKYLG